MVKQQRLHRLLFLILSVPLLMGQTRVEDLLRLGATQLQSQDYQEAIASFNQAIALNPKLAQAYTLRCQAKRHLADYIAAIADCDRAINLDPNAALAYLQRGRIRAELDDVFGALTDMSTIIDQPTRDRKLLAEAYLQRGTLRAYFIGEKESGLADVRTAANLFRQLNAQSDYQRSLTVLDILKRQEY